MTTTEAVTTDRRDVLVEQLFQATIGAQDSLHVYLGDKVEHDFWWLYRVDP